jgi:hypothetical protein
MISAWGSNRLTNFSPADRLTGQHPPLARLDDTFDQRAIVTHPGLPEFDERIGCHSQFTVECRFARFPEILRRNPQES